MLISTIMTDAIQHYLEKGSTPPHPILLELLAETAKLPHSKMATDINQIQFIAWLLKLITAKRVIELGVYTGCATLGMALALPAGGEIIACDVDKRWINRVGIPYWEAAEVMDIISLHIAPASETLTQLLESEQAASFDAIFIDADKRGYPNYYQQALLLIRPGGLIMMDNMLWGGNVANTNVTDPHTEAIRVTLAMMQQDERVDLSLIPVGDGMALARKR